MQDVMVVDASEGQIFLATFESDNTTNLYISESQGVRFSLSLRNVVYFDPDGANRDSFLRSVLLQIQSPTLRSTPVKPLTQSSTLHSTLTQPLLSHASHQTSHEFVDVHRVDGMRGVYIASVVQNATLDPSQQMTMITFDKGGRWQFLDVSSHPFLIFISFSFKSHRFICCFASGARSRQRGTQH